MAGHMGAATPHNFLLDHVSPATRLLEKRRQMFEIQEALEAQKEEFSRQGQRSQSCLQYSRIHKMGSNYSASEIYCVRFKTGWQPSFVTIR